LDLSLFKGYITPSRVLKPCPISAYPGRTLLFYVVNSKTSFTTMRNTNSQSYKQHSFLLEVFLRAPFITIFLPWRTSYKPIRAEDQKDELILTWWMQKLTELSVVGITVRPHLPYYQ
jgi:hypothetical protein